MQALKEETNNFFFKEQKKKKLNVDKQSRKCRLGKPSGGGMLL
jgi:hypothetical protein